MLQIIKVENEYEKVYANLIQAYEAEFSTITLKKPGKDGLFILDTNLGPQVHGYLLYEADLPIGFIAVLLKDRPRFEVCEFYIVPSCRRLKFGEKFAHTIFDMYQGEWEVKQIAGATFAHKFWKQTISNYTKSNFEEDIFEDAYWGKVRLQKFKSRNREEKASE